jgi:nitroreductase
MEAMGMDLNTLLRARYGADAPEIDTNASSAAANAVLRTLLAHRSIRHYRPDPLPAGALAEIVAAAQSAATSSNLQTWSVVALQNPDHKAQAALLCGDQEFIRQAPLFLVFCADLARLTSVSESVGLPGAGLDYFEMFLMATIDASLAAQNAATAAEALGLGICYVGAARNRPRELAALLELPKRVFALFGMAIGHPDPQQMASIKPRLPQPEVLHRETYSDVDRARWIEHYNATALDFYRSQQMNVRGDWSQHSARRVATVEALNGRDVLREILHERGFGLK